MSGHCIRDRTNMFRFQNECKVIVFGSGEILAFAGTSGIVFTQTCVPLGSRHDYGVDNSGGCGLALKEDDGG